MLLLFHVFQCASILRIVFSVKAKNKIGMFLFHHTANIPEVLLNLGVYMEQFSSFLQQS
jgi:hypothetical protein